MTTTANADASRVGATTTSSRQAKSSCLQGFLSSIGKRRSSIVEENTTLSIADELSTYRSLAIKEFNEIIEQIKEPDPFSFWNSHGRTLKFLSMLARKHLIVPSTSVPSESTFSMASFIGRKERSRLIPENLCTLVFLRDKINDKRYFKPPIR